MHGIQGVGGGEKACLITVFVLRGKFGKVLKIFWGKALIYSPIFFFWGSWNFIYLFNYLFIYLFIHSFIQ